MDALKIETIHLLEQLVCASEGLLNVQITQDLDKEELIIEDQNHELTTHMNCSMNSVGATIRQLCNHINKRDLFSYDDKEYTIGM